MILAILPLCPALPGILDWFIVATGGLLVLGAVSAEKQLLADHSRQYEGMHTLFAAGAQGLNELLKVASHEPDRADEAISQMQRLLFDLGKEGLDENGAWLILHRARPAEPFLAG